MSRAELIYPLRRNLEKQLGLIGKDQYNKDILTRYYKVRSSKIALATQVLEFNRLNIMSRMLKKKFEDATVQDMEDLVFRINQQHHNASTQNKYRKILKAFYRWLRGYPKGEFPPDVKWIELNRVPLIKVTEDDLLPYEECVRITEFATNLRDKALFQCNLDAGCRIGEILPVKVGEAKFNEIGAILQSDGKTGPAPLILTWSAKTLALWLNIHPFRNDKDAPLFPVLDRRAPEQLSYCAARKAFKDCVKKAGHTRRVWLHLLKHVSSSEDSAKGLPDAFRRYKHHWTPNSRMPEVYEHLSQSIIPRIQSETWNRYTGQKVAAVPAPEQDMQLIKKCNRCEFENPRDSLFCNRCAFPLDERKAAEIMMPPELKPREQELKEKIRILTEELAKSPEVVDKLLDALDILRRGRQN
jgi:integrase